MKAYRFEAREKPKFELGFWALYGYIVLSSIIFNVVFDSVLLQAVPTALVLIVLFIICVDLNGYNVHKTKLRRKKK